LSSYGVEFFFSSGAGHRAALALRGEGLGDGVSSNDPKKEGVPMPLFYPLTEDPADLKTAQVLNEFIRQSSVVLANHPVNRARNAKNLPVANAVLIRGAGKMGRFEQFSERYGLTGGVISAASLITGIGRVVGLSPIPVPGITGSTDTDIAAKVNAAITALGTMDFVLVNIKGADEAGHDGLALEKKEFIERVDTALEPLLRLPGCLIVVCGDHSTPCTIKDHSADPVPLVIRGEGVRVDRTGSFDEFSCAEGALHRIRGGDLMPILLDLIDRTHKYGA
ncbi:MAG: phosphoglycerate mutase, partial [Methanoregulaceae archaeon]|nr:phosphoglycerate mutase [Methanoregulaceae archaeon]